MSQSAAPSSAHRLVQLDALRGLAAAAVVLFHFTTRYGQMFGHTRPLAVEVPWGGYGVDLFFMLSGFVIFMTLERTSSTLDFAVGRLSRLYPAYWASLAITFVIVSLAGLPGEEVSFGDAVVNLTMVQRLLGRPHVDGVYWSLQAELLFYVAMIVLYRCGAFSRVFRTVMAWVGLSVVVHLGVVHGDANFAGLPNILTKVQTLLSLKYIPLFAIGIGLYDLRKGGRFEARHAVWFAACTLAHGLIDSWNSMIVGMALMTVVGLAVHGRLPMLAARPLVYLGTISYTLYLTHQNLGYVLMRQLESWGLDPHLAIVLAGLMALSLAALLSHTVEGPAMRRIRTLWKSRTAAARAASTTATAGVSS